MKPILVWLTLGCALLAGGRASAASEQTLCVMTFNILFANPKPPHSWLERRPVLRDCVRAIAPDVIGTQESTFKQVRQMVADLPEYGWIGLGTEGGSRSSLNAVLFRKDRLEPLAYDFFWLSDTPEAMGSNTWGARYPRAVTWVEFADRRSGRRFYLANTHFDHLMEGARVKSAQFLRQRLSGLKEKLPVIITGDFNCAAGQSPAYDVLTAGGFLADAWLQAKERRGRELDTFHGFEPPKNTGRRIDWILLGGAVQAQAAQVVDFSREGEFPSDHFPVAAWVELH